MRRDRLSILTPARRSTLVALIRFAIVGCAGLTADIATVYALRNLIGVYAAGLAAFPVAATVTWSLNRTWTFRGPHRGTRLAQWARFMAANIPGFLLNRGVFEALVAGIPFVHDHPVLAAAAGAVAGLFVNFTASRRLVFR